MAFVRKTSVFCVIFLTLHVFIQVKAFGPCIYDSQCGLLKYCCDRRYPENNICRSNCIGESCILNSDCAPGESCCNATDKCATSCVGESCSSSYDCATGECCDSNGECSSGDCGLAG